MSSFHPPDAPPILHSFRSTEALTIAIAAFIAGVQKRAIEKRKRFSVAISGGSMPRLLTGLNKRSDIQWDKWHIWFSDERLVPQDDPESNFGLCKKEVFDHLPVLPKNIHHIDEELVKQLQDASNPNKVEELIEDITDEYEKQLIAGFGQKDAARFPVFDLILLGMGHEGHICSLFPGHPLLDEKDRWVVNITDAPQPPAQRITLTYPVINHAANVMFIVSGEGKQEILSKVLDHPELGLPGSRVRPKHPGKVYWFTDDQATAQTEYQRTQFQV